MKIIFILIILFNASLCAKEANPLAFIGTIKSAEITSLSCDDILDIDEKILCSGNIIKVVYEIDEKLAGDYDKSQVVFYDIYHYEGLPKYMTGPWAYILVMKEKKGYVKSRGAAVGVTGDNEDNWVCTNSIAPSMIKSSFKESYTDEAEHCETAVLLADIKKFYENLTP